MSPSILPYYPKVGDNEIDQAVGLALGAASMCWEPRPEGIFDSTTASQITNELISLIKRHVEEKGGSL